MTSADLVEDPITWLHARGNACGKCRRSTRTLYRPSASWLTAEQQGRQFCPACAKRWERELLEQLQVEVAEAP